MNSGIDYDWLLLLSREESGVSSRDTVGIHTQVSCQRAQDRTWERPKAPQECFLVTYNITSSP